MRKISLLLIGVLAFVSMGASKCDNGGTTPPPQPVDISGAWNIKCEKDPTPTELMKSYSKNDIVFHQDKTLDIYHSYGTLVKKTSNGTFDYVEDQLSLFNSAGQLVDTYKVASQPDTSVLLTGAADTCTLVKVDEPVILSGPHPSIDNAVVEVTVYINGQPLFKDVELSSPSLYLIPQTVSSEVIKNGLNLGLALLHIQVDGSLPSHYAFKAFVTKGTSIVVASSDDVFGDGLEGSLMFTDGSDNIEVEYSVVIP